MFCKDRGIDFSVSGCAGDTRVMCAPSTFEYFHFTARHCWGFPLYRPLHGKRSISNASTAIEIQTFSAGVTKNIILCGKGGK